MPSLTPPMVTRWLLGILLSSLLGAASLADLASAVPPEPAAPRTENRLELRVEPLADFWFYLRSLADADEAPAGDFSEAVEAFSRVETALRAERESWGRFDSVLRSVTTGAELRNVFQEVESPALRDVFVDAAQEMEQAFPVFLKTVWPEHERAILAARERIEKDFRPVEAKAFRYMLDSLDMVDPAAEIPVYLVARGPWPEAFTRRTYGGGTVVFVGVLREQHQGTLLYEILLHEATHALDMTARESPHALMRLRDLLRERGVEDRSLLRTVPHNLMFIQAGETIRRFVDPEHVDYGVVSEYYDRAEHAWTEREIWHRYLAGETTLDGALAEIAGLPVVTAKAGWTRRLLDSPLQGDSVSHFLTVRRNGVPETSTSPAR